MNKNNMPEDELDDLFRKSASAYEPEFDEAAWRAMEQKLDAHQPQNTLWRRLGWGIPLLLLIGLGSWFGFDSITNKTANPTTAPTGTETAKPENKAKSKETAITISERKNIPLAKAPVKKLEDENTIFKPTPIAESKANTEIITKDKRAGEIVAVASNYPSQPGRNKTEKQQSKNPTRILLENEASSSSTTKTSGVEEAGQESDYQKAALNILPVDSAANKVAAASTSVDNEKASPPENIPTASTENTPSASPTDSTAKASKKPALHLSRLAITLLAAPDLSSVGFSSPGGISTNAGVVLSYFITSRISFSTGLIKARKIYTAQPEDYNVTPGFWQNHYEMQNIDAACRVLDIPINLGYQVWQKNKSALSVNTGLSSYLMQHERYDYAYQYYGKEMYKTWEVENQNRHLFSMYNLSVGYARQLNKTVSLGAEPFMKVPLTGVGAGKVKLASAGIFFSLTYRHLRN